MAIKIQGTTVVDDSRQLTNIQSIDAPSVTALQNAGLGAQETTVNKSLVSGQELSIDIHNPLSVPVLSVVKEQPSTNLTTGNRWDVGLTGNNYTQYATSYDADLLLNINQKDDLSAVKLINDLDISNNNPFTSGIFFKPDGTEMYLAEYFKSSGEFISQYTLSTPWDISTASFKTLSPSLVSIEDAYDVYIRNDGVKLYVTAVDRVQQYTLNTPWDISTAVYDNLSFSVESSTYGSYFKPDGTKLYITGSYGELQQYTLSTPWDISTASFDFKINLSGSPQSIAFNPDGSVLYIVDRINENIESRPLSTPWDISTSSFGSSFSITKYDQSRPYGIFYNGLSMYLVGAGPDKIFQFIVGNPTNKLTLSNALSFSDDDVGKNIDLGGSGDSFILSKNESNDFVYISEKEFLASNINAGSWSLNGMNVSSSSLTLSGELNLGYYLTNATYNNKTLDLSTETGTSTPLSLFLRDDNAKLYVLSGTNIYQYTLSTPGDILTASYDNITFDVSSQDTNPLNVFFKFDGTRMWVIGGSTSAETIIQYNLSTPWDVSTSTLSNTFNALGSRDIYFKPDGSKFYIINTAFTPSIEEYPLDDDWDITVPSVQTDDEVEFLIDGETSFPVGLYFNSNGTRMFVIDTNETVYQYTLQNYWDISSASYDNIMFDVSTQMDFSADISFTNDGTKMLVLDGTNSIIYEYSTQESFNVIPRDTSIAITDPINTRFWESINDVVTNETLNDGNINYAISTNPDSSWSVFNSLGDERIIARKNNGTWEYNNNHSDFTGESWITSSENNKLTALYEAINDDGLAETGLEFASLANSFDVTNEIGSRPGINLTFKPDGTKMYLAVDEYVTYQYTLSTPWNVSTASYDNISFTSQFQDTDGEIYSISFKSDGTALYLSGRDKIAQFSLATAWDLSSVNPTVDKTAVMSGYAIHIKPDDGTKLYAANRDIINQYDLNTPWDVSSLSLSKTFDISGLPGSAGGFSVYITLESDGTKAYVSAGDREVVQLDLSTPWDISTASYNNVILNMPDWYSAEGLFINTDINKLYVVKFFPSPDVIEEYNLFKVVQNNIMSPSTFQNVNFSGNLTVDENVQFLVGLKLDSGIRPTYSALEFDYSSRTIDVPAITGSDYTWGVVENDRSKLKITALSDENFKIRII